MEYQKINSLFKRDREHGNVIIPSETTMEEFVYLHNCIWECTEKIDGTNMRLEVLNNRVEIKGRTERANIPSHLFNYMRSTFPDDKVISALSSDEKQLDPSVPVTIYGEGYGMKIQNGGNYIHDGVRFILFDVRVGNWWLSRYNCELIANKLGVDIVPIVGYMNIDMAINMVRDGFKSKIAENKDFLAEGLVLKTPCGLNGRNGERIIGKLKTIDFVKYNNYINGTK